ncbi:MAG: hypothetical protein ACOX8S_07615 [Christensenellales bacterium]
MGRCNEQVLVTAINQTLCDKDSFLATLQGNIETVLSQGNDQVLADIDKRLKELQAELLKLATSNADYDNVGNEIYRLRDEKQKLMVENANREELKNRMPTWLHSCGNNLPPSQNTTNSLSGG